MTAPEREQTLIGSVQRALSLVDIVARAARPVPVKALAAASGLTSGTTYNLVRTLVHEGYLANEPDGVILGPRFHGFLTPNDSSGVFLALVREALNAASDIVGASAYFARYGDGEIHLIDIVDAPRSPRTELWVGMQASAHATALGKQILAELPPSEVRDYLARNPLRPSRVPTHWGRRVRGGVDRRGPDRRGPAPRGSRGRGSALPASLPWTDD
ncbi:IclR family transcriptional regulator [Microbacterium sp. EF45047]|uniref:IclR family transcriptional regulator n=1 Tax=Microbacterium sp. EF45047 TaxID=2809708 RepID=UPI00234BEE2E|nr:helix-turn-helix domain-containing protein [Microbacterium sp. EF45047]WCM56256.1 helix-turn-helix domain-containing protein [Microbacterium sp. EF45047]